MAILNNYYADPATIKYNCLNVSGRMFVSEGIFGFGNDEIVVYTCNNGISILKNGEPFTTEEHIKERYIKVVGGDTWARVLSGEENKELMASVTELKKDWVCRLYDKLTKIFPRLTPIENTLDPNIIFLHDLDTMLDGCWAELGYSIINHEYNYDGVSEGIETESDDIDSGGECCEDTSEEHD